MSKRPRIVRNMVEYPGISLFLPHFSHFKVGPSKHSSTPHHVLYSKSCIFGTAGNLILENRIATNEAMGCTKVTTRDDAK